VEQLHPVKKSEALEIGSNYHSKIEQLYKDEYFDSDFSKDSAMACAYEKYIYPKFEMRNVEKWVSKEVLPNNMLIGIVDGIAEDGSLVEHKTTGLNSIDEFLYNLEWDEQILAYMYMTGQHEMYYTVCRKPTIRQKKDESDEEFFYRMCQWYDTDTDNKIRVEKIKRTDKQIKEFVENAIIYIDDIGFAQSEGNSNIYYRNTCHCNHYGRCEYAPICLNYNPDVPYADFVKKEREADKLIF
jgi:hypothetical protein